MRKDFSEVMRSRRVRPWPALSPCLLMVALLAPAAATARAEQIRNHFDSDSVMRPPGFFDLVVLGAPAKARWLILTDPNPPSAPNRLAQVETARPADSLAAAVRRNVVFQDGTVSTWVKQSSAHEGLLLRMKDEKTFLTLLVDPSGAVVLSSHSDGKVSELGRGQTTAVRPWERYSVKAAGAELSVFFNDQKLFDARDPHPVAGRTGLVTGGPGEASFDEFLIDFERKP